MYNNFGRRTAEDEILWKLEREFCNSTLLRNPRTIEDVVNQLEKYCIHWYSPQTPFVNDIEYTNCILPRIEMLVNDDNHFRVTDKGNIIISLPLLQEDDRGNHETEKDIQYNYLKEETIEKVSIFDHRRYGIDRLFKSIRYVYDRNGIETERQIEMLKRDKESSRTIYFFKERLKDNPHILKITQNSRGTKERGMVSYYDIRLSRQIEDLDQTKGKKIEEKDIRGLTEDEKQEVIARQINPIYQQGIKSLMGIGIEPGGR